MNIFIIEINRKIFHFFHVSAVEKNYMIGILVLKWFDMMLDVIKDF